MPFVPSSVLVPSGKETCTGAKGKTWPCQPVKPVLSCTRRVVLSKRITNPVWKRFFHEIRRWHFRQKHQPTLHKFRDGSAALHQPWLGKASAIVESVKMRGARKVVLQLPHVRNKFLKQVTLCFDTRLSQLSTAKLRRYCGTYELETKAETGQSCGCLHMCCYPIICPKLKL